MPAAPQPSDNTLKQAQELIAKKQYGEAEPLLLSLLDQGLSVQPVFELLGVIAMETTRYDTALARFQQAIMADVKVASSHYHLGALLEKMGKLEEAIQSYTRAAKLQPDVSAPLLRVINILILADRRPQALPYCIRLCQIIPFEKQGWDIYVQLIEQLDEFYEVEKELVETIKIAMEKGLHNGLRVAMLRQIQFSDWMVELAGISTQKDLPTLIKEIDAKIASPDFLTRMQHPFLLNLMQRNIISHRFMEWVLNCARRYLLLNPKVAAQEELRPFLLALWSLGFHNEYVFYVEEDERPAIEALRNSLNQSFDKGESPDIVSLALLGSYAPLCNEGFAEKLKDWQPEDAETAEILKEQIHNVFDERERAKAIPTLTEIKDETTRKVRDQYEKAPYPRWTELPHYDPISLETYISRFGAVSGEYEPLPEMPKDILVAGCGTGQHPIMLASSLRDYQLTAVDISLASLSYAQRKADEFSVSNIKFMQADILTLDKLEQKFDMIESIGVLHHMKDPVAGWKVLTQLLKPGGMMRIGLYSEIARECITLARDEIRERELGDSDDAIRAYRRELMSRYYQYRVHGEEDGQPLTLKLSKLFAATDFYALSECRDLIFHVQEHQFTLPQIKQVVQELGLSFVGLNLMNIATLEAFQRSLPAEERDSHLDKWHEYELEHPDTFNGMYQFWLQKPRD